MLRRFRSFVRSIREAEAWHGLFTWGPFGTYLAPIVAGVAAMIAGVFENVPVMWIMVGATMLVALVTRLHITLKEYVESLDPATKLFFDGMEIRTEDQTEGVFSPARLMSVGIGLGNAGDVPIGFFVEDWHLVLSGKTLTDRRPILRYEIAGRTGAAYFDLPHMIDYGDLRQIRCVLRFTLRYGFKGSENCSMKKELEFRVQQRPDGNLLVSHVDEVQREPDGTIRKLGLRASSAVSRSGFEPRPVVSVVRMTTTKDEPPLPQPLPDTAPRTPL